MISQKNAQKVREFYRALQLTKQGPGLEIGLIVVKEETLGDLGAIYFSPNEVSTYDLTDDYSARAFLRDLSQTIKTARLNLVRMHSFLDSEIYNQLYLLCHSGRMQYRMPEKTVVIDASLEAKIILVTTDEELGKMNNTEFLNLIGPVLRLE